MADIVQKVKVDEQASAPLKDIAAANEELARSTRKAAEEAKHASEADRELADSKRTLKGGINEGVQASEELTAQWERGISMARNLVGALIGVGGISEAVRAVSEDMRESARVATELANAQLDLLFLSQSYSGESVATVDEVANQTGRSRVEVTRALAGFTSKTAHLDETQRLGFFKEMAQTSMTTDSPMESLVDLFAKGSMSVEDPQRLQNIMRKTQELSPEASPAALASLLPRVLPFANALKMSPEQVAGLSVTAMSVAGSPDLGITSLRNMMLNLSGGATPEGQELLTGVGADPEIGFLKQMEALSTAVGNGSLDLTSIGTIVGKENSQVMLSMLQNPSLMRSNVDSIVAAGQGSRDLTDEAMMNIMGASEPQRLRLAGAQAKSRIEGVRVADIEAQRAQLAKTILEEEMLKRGQPGFMRSVNLTAFDARIAAGGSVDDAIRFTADGGLLEDVMGRYRGAVDPELNAIIARNPSLRAVSAEVEAEIGSFAGGGRPMRDPGGSIVIIYNNSVINQEGNPGQAPSPAQQQP